MRRYKGQVCCDDSEASNANSLRKSLEVSTWYQWSSSIHTVDTFELSVIIIQVCDMLTCAEDDEIGLIISTLTALRYNATVSVQSRLYTAKLTSIPRD